MKVTVSREELNNGLSYLKECLLAKSEVPIFTYIILETKNSNLVLSTSNGKDIATYTIFEVNIEQEGSIGIVNDFVKIIGQCEAEEVTLNLIKEDTTHITCGKYSAKLSTRTKEALDEFPELPEASSTVAVPIPDIKEHLKYCGVTVGEDEDNIKTVGLNIEISKDRLTLQATDGQRLTHCISEIKVPEEFATIKGSNWIEEKELLRFIVDKHSVKILKKNTWEEILIGFDNHILFKSEKAELYVNLRQNDFVDFTAHLQDLSGAEVSVNKLALKKALGRVVIFSEESKKTQDVSFHLKDGKMILFGGFEKGTSKEELEVSFTGDAKFIIKSSYLIEYINSTSDTDLNFKLAESGGQFVKLIVDKEGFTHIIALSSKG